MSTNIGENICKCKEITKKKLLDEEGIKTVLNAVDSRIDVIVKDIEDINTNTGNIEISISEIPIISGTGIISGVSKHERSIASGNGAMSLGGATEAIGMYSTAINNQTKAEANNSFASGLLTRAISENTHAEGYKTCAGDNGETIEINISGSFRSGFAAHSEGAGTLASGIASHSEGIGTQALGKASKSSGNGTIANAENSIAEGYKTQATGKQSHAEGNQTLAQGQQSHAEGFSTLAEGQNSHAEGNKSKAIGNHSHAEGNGTIANGGASHAEGSGTITTNDFEHAEGRYNVSNKDRDSDYWGGNNTVHSVGIGTGINKRKNAHEILQDGKHYIYGIGGYDGTNVLDLDGETATASDLATVVNNKVDKSDLVFKKGDGLWSAIQENEYSPNMASGNYSSALGEGTTVSGYAAHAEGINCIANGRASHAEGWYTITNNEGEHASGIYNVSNGDTQFSIGVGVSEDDRKNAFEVKQNGDIYIGGVSNTLQSNINNANAAIDILTGDGEGSVIKIVKDEIAEVVASAPEDLDTLKELSDALKKNKDVIDVLNSAIDNKADKTTVEMSINNINDTISGLLNIISTLESEINYLKNVIKQIINDEYDEYDQQIEIYTLTDESTLVDKDEKQFFVQKQLTE